MREGEKTNRNNYFSAMTEKTIHEGRNVKRIREILGIKQDTLAMEKCQVKQSKTSAKKLV